MLSTEAGIEDMLAVGGVTPMNTEYSSNLHHEYSILSIFFPLNTIWDKKCGLRGMKSMMNRILYGKQTTCFR